MSDDQLYEFMIVCDIHGYHRRILSFCIWGKNVRPPNLSLPPRFCFSSLCYCQFIERAICWCASLRQEPDALSDRLDASDPQWLAPVRHTGGSSTGMLGPPLWRTGSLPPRSSTPSQPNAYLNCATAYKDAQAPNRTFNQVQMPHESKIDCRETFHPASVCTNNQIHWRLYSTHCCVYPKERCFSKQFRKSAVPSYSPQINKFNMKSKFYSLKTCSFS